MTGRATDHGEEKEGKVEPEGRSFRKGENDTCTREKTLQSVSGVVREGREDYG